MPAASAAVIEAATFEWNAAKPEKRSEFEPAPAGSRGDAAEHVVAAEQVSDAVLADQPGRRLGIELGEADDMRAAGERSHRRGIPEGAAQRRAASSAASAVSRPMRRATSAACPAMVC